MDARRFAGEVVVFGLPGTGEMMGEVGMSLEASDIIELRNPCMLQITPHGQLQMRDLIKGNKVIRGEYYFLNALTVSYAFYPSNEMVSAYKAMRAGIMMPTLAADPPQIQIGRNDN
jgi:hypothetical protein